MNKKFVDIFQQCKTSVLQLNKNIYFILFLIGFIIVWHVIASANIWPSYVFPAPFLVFSALLKGFSDGTFISAVFSSLKLMIIGFLIAAVAGVFLGILIAKSRIFEHTVGQLILGIQSLPSICWLPLAVLWFGLNENAIIFVVIIGAIGSITMAISSGISQVNPLYLNAAKTMGARGRKLYSEVIFPAALPTTIAGARQGWSFAWRSLMAGEMIFFTGGLGQLLQTGRELNDINQVVAVMIVIMIIGFLIEKLIFNSLENDMKTKWGLTKR